MKRFARLMTVAVIAGAVALAGPGRAQADILLTVSDGNPADTQMFTSSALTPNHLSQDYTIDGYTVNTEVVNTNLPGGVTGTLTTSTSIENVTGSPAAPLTILAQVVTPGTVGDGLGGFVPGTGGLANFTSPTGTTLALRTDVTAAGTSGNPLASIVGTSTANGFTTSDGLAVINPNLEVTTTGTFPAPAGTYTLQNQSLITGLLTGDTSITLGVSTTVSAPEPATLASILSVLPIVGLAAWRRNRTKRA